ncbi:kynureninase-like isoform X2 [Centruroides sculpturatus]|uniref:kynureninase-like isoform X2 n=1 Tax=Centruroides sculpturatus TaxID=218467 RepID=UPI000C6CA96E|nr:kynureninase-like isoform X2 [Centruroides sculpturatus]
MWPKDVLEKKAEEWRCDVYSRQFAENMDKEDPLKEFRQRFHYPQKKNFSKVDMSLSENEEEECLYFCGNSLGLQPKSVQNYVQNVLDDWKHLGVESHFVGSLPSALCDLYPKEIMAKLVGAKKDEIAIMNGLTVNLHLLLVSFYEPTPQRHKILIEAKAFPSDMGEDYVRHEDVVSMIEKEGDQISVILLPGIQYFTGQLFDIKTITEIGHKKGCIVGFDLAHTVGNTELHLHDWDVDFAAWCTYKYLNAGPGGVAAIFVNEKHTHNRKDFPKLRGWWGVDPKMKFIMNEQRFHSCTGADMFKLSNPSPVLITMLMASLKVIEEATLKEILKKQFLLTGYFEMLIKHYFCKDENSVLKVITPPDPRCRGSQLTLQIKTTNHNMKSELEKRGIICDMRKDCYRVAPIPLYNTYLEGYKFVQILQTLLKN